MASPIQQLVDAAKEVLEFATPRRLNWPTAPPARLHAAIRAVESAQVETWWVAEYWHSECWLEWYTALTYDVAKAELKSELPHALTRIIRIDTYRSVESDQ